MKKNDVRPMAYADSVHGLGGALLRLSVGLNGYAGVDAGDGAGVVTIDISGPVGSLPTSWVPLTPRAARVFALMLLKASGHGQTAEALMDEVIAENEREASS